MFTFVVSYCLDCMCVFFLFFFFKQKTAYEMRISDWSSDVCSSDLTPLPPAVAGSARESWHRRADRAMHRSCRQPPENRSNSAGLRVVDEIGRASCRERVCQYV